MPSENLLPSPVSHFLFLVSCLPSPVPSPCLPYPVSCLPSPFLCLTSPVSGVLCHTFPVSCLLSCLLSYAFCTTSLVSFLMSPVSCLTSSFSHLLSHVSRLTSPVSSDSYLTWYISCFTSPVLRLSQASCLFSRLLSERLMSSILFPLSTIHDNTEHKKTFFVIPEDCCRGEGETVFGVTFQDFLLRVLTRIRMLWKNKKIKINHAVSYILKFKKSFILFFI